MEIGDGRQKQRDYDMDEHSRLPTAFYGLFSNLWRGLGFVIVVVVCWGFFLFVSFPKYRLDLLC